jgi:tRNA (guanine-N7-)-methyltransferase
VTEEISRRPVRSFVRREGRMTAAQARALEALWPRYGVEYDSTLLDLDAVFGRHALRTLEIGFGNGDLLLWLAQEHPDRDYLGVEVHRPGVGRLLLRLERENIGNVRVICHDAVDVLAHQLPRASLDEILLLFPDPWPKKRHHKRRIVQPELVALAAAALRAGGWLRLATDWREYAEHMRAVMSASPAFELVPDARAPRPPTRFETRGRSLGHEVWDYCYRRGDGAQARQP